MVLPTFFVLGAPKAGTTALHEALAASPDLFLSPVKEPKHFLCGDRPPDPRRHRGPGDAHSAREWVWQRSRYEALFDAAPPGVPRGESTPFYLSDLDAQRRIAAAVPDARVVVLLRDPVDRAHSNWMHLWSDGLEPEADLRAAMADEDRRIAAGWAPMWHYRRLGRYGEQLEHLYGVLPREQVLVLRYRELVDEPAATVARVCGFLGVAAPDVPAAPHANVKGFRDSSPRNARIAAVVRAGAVLGAHLPPQVWRAAIRPLVAALHHGAGRRPKLGPEDRRELVELFADDVRRLEAVTGASYADWLSDEGRGDFASRRADSPAA